MKQSKFDIVMDYIDENIQKDTETIKKGIYGLIHCNSITFEHHFSILTGGDTLGNYIRNRRLYFAAMELLHKPKKPICDIARDYGYSEQSAFTRAISGKYKMSPNEIRTARTVEIENEKYLFSDFDPNPSDARSDRIWREFEHTGYISPDNLEYLDEIQRGQEEFGFDIDTCYAIADLAERLEIPVRALMAGCFDLVVDVKSDPQYIPPQHMVAISLGIKSDEELEAICNHYNCKYYDLNRWMVMSYHGIEF